MYSGKDIGGAAFSAPVTKPQPCGEKKTRVAMLLFLDTPGLSPGFCAMPAPRALADTIVADNGANTPYIGVTS